MIELVNHLIILPLHWLKFMASGEQEIRFTYLPIVPPSPQGRG